MRPKKKGRKDPDFTVQQPVVLDWQAWAVQPRLCAQVWFTTSGKHLFFNKGSLIGAWVEHKKSGVPSLFVNSWAGSSTVRLWEALPVLSSACGELCFGLCGSGSWADTVQVPLSRPQCALEQITHFYFYTKVHNFINFLWLLWQEKEIYDAHHPFIWHRQCLLLREAFSWNWLHNFLLVYCFQVISQDLSVLRYTGTSLRPTEYYSREKMRPYNGK